MSRGPYPILLMLAMSLPGAVRALGLGDIRIDSALNEPLSAQIDIVGATRDELAVLTASVANHEIFQRYGADRPSFLASATFKVGLDGQGHPVLNVRSTDPFTDPLVSFLVDLRWGKNDIVREYSLLLDPPGYKYPRPAAEVVFASATAAPSSAAPAPISAGNHRSAPVARVAAPASIMREVADGQSRITIAAGDTLRGVARRAGARNEAQAQTMMIAIFRANPGAFDGNINRLHRGAVLTIPTAAEMAAVQGADAKREVRAHMTAWRRDGRPAAMHRLANATAAPAAAPVAAAASMTPVASTVPVAKEMDVPDASLKDRVQTLQQQLDDAHKQLASENAKIQDLKQSAPTVAAVAPVTAAASTPVALQPQAAANQSSPARSAELVQTPIVASIKKTRASQATGTAGTTPTSSAAIFGPVALTVGLFIAGFAYVRRRLVKTPNVDVAAAADMPIEPAVASPGAAVAVARSAPATPAASMPVPTARTVSNVATPPPAKRADAATVDTLEQPGLPASGETTSNLEIDIEALERSYLESLPADPTAVETTTVETVGIDAEELNTALGQADLNTVLMGTKDLGNAPIDKTTVDFDLLDLDATAQHVHMPSGLHDHPVVSERRTNIVDVLKMAIERDPNRRDLRMKLLETYYSVAAANQRAFMDVVRKLSREKEGFSPEDWQKVAKMGREIAADDILFADLSNPVESKSDEDLLNCA